MRYLVSLISILCLLLLTSQDTYYYAKIKNKNSNGNIMMIYFGDSYVKGNWTYNSLDSIDLKFQGTFPNIQMVDSPLNVVTLNTYQNNNLLPTWERGNNFSFPLILNYNLSQYYDTVVSAVYGVGGTMLFPSAFPDWNIVSSGDLYEITDSILDWLFPLYPWADSTNTHLIIDLATNDLSQGHVNTVYQYLSELITAYVDSFPQLNYSNVSMMGVIDLVTPGFATQQEQDTVDYQLQQVFDSLNLENKFELKAYQVSGDNIHLRASSLVSFGDSNYIKFVP